MQALWPQEWQIEVNGSIMEDARWLHQPEDAEHVNLAELGEAIKDKSDTSVTGVGVTFGYRFDMHALMDI